MDYTDQDVQKIADWMEKKIRKSCESFHPIPEDEPLWLGLYDVPGREDVLWYTTRIVNRYCRQKYKHLDNPLAPLCDALAFFIFSGKRSDRPISNSLGGAMIDAIVVGTQPPAIRAVRGNP